MNFFHGFRTYQLSQQSEPNKQPRSGTMYHETPNRSHFFVSTSLFRDALPRSHRHAGFHENNSSIPKLFLSSTNKSSNRIRQVGICREHLAYVTKLYHYIRVSDDCKSESYEYAQRALPAPLGGNGVICSRPQHFIQRRVLLAPDVAL